jgi:DNA-binding MarR family transcriptional regulator
MEDSAPSLIADVSRLMRRAFDERARTIGVTRQQWQMLTYLARNEGINQGGLAYLMEVEPITLCRMVDRLQDSDLVERRSDPADRRAWQLFLTERGRARLDDLRPLAEVLYDEAMAGINEKEQVAMIAALKAMRTNLSRRALPPQEAVNG